MKHCLAEPLCATLKVKNNTCPFVSLKASRVPPFLPSLTRCPTLIQDHSITLSPAHHVLPSAAMGVRSDRGVTAGSPE